MKCFDSIEFTAIQGALNYFHFGPYFMKMIMTLYANFRTSVLHNGFQSDYIYPTHDIHQGCAVSSYLYILNAEILSTNIKSNVNIKGIPIGNITEMVVQYVDDMTVATLFDTNSVNAIVNELEDFRNNTGLKANYEKTTIFCIGKAKFTNKKLNLNQRFKWADMDINILGITLDDQELLKSYSKVLNKTETITKIWAQRPLTRKGKIVVLNSLIGSLLVYKMQVLPTIDKNIQIRINRIIEQFIWNSRKPK